MAEFFSDWHRQSYLEGLEREKSFAEARLPKAKYEKDPLSVAELNDRIKQVDDEIARVKGIELASAEETFETKPVSKLKVAELDEQYGQIDGYPVDGKHAEKVEFVEGYLAAQEA